MWAGLTFYMPTKIHFVKQKQIEGNTVEIMNILRQQDISETLL